MAGINLLDQLKGKKNSGLSNSTPSAPKMNFSMSGGTSDALGLLLRLLFLVIIGYGGFLGLERYQQEEASTLRAELSQLDAGLAKENKKKSEMKNVGEEMRGYQARVDELQGKLKAVSQQETDRSFLIRALEYAAAEMPKEVWFNEITAAKANTTPGQQAVDGEGSATFKGYAINAQAVSDFIQKLEASVYFPKTTLDRLELVSGPEISTPTPGAIPVPPNTRKFQIMAKLGE